MPATLLDSQLETLELPDPDEAVWSVDIAHPVDVIVSRLVARAEDAAIRDANVSDPHRA
jgi:gluconate kinase